jgi:hypothetical protein
MAHRSTSVSFLDYREMLYQAVGRLPKGVKVVLLADRGFSHTELMQAATTQLGWHYRIRLKNTTWLWRAGKGLVSAEAFHCKRGEALCLHHVKLHKQQAYGPVHLIVGRNNVNGEFWAIASDETTTLQTFNQYGLRFDIEESFLDDQSNGWNIQKSEIRSVCALSRLCSFWRWRPFMSLPKGLRSSRLANVGGSIPIGFVVTAIFASVGSGSKQP